MPTSPEQLMTQFRLVALAPEIILVLVAMAVLIMGAFFPDHSQRRVLPLLALFGAVLSAAATGALWNKNLVFGPAERAIYGADNFALFFKGLFLLSLIVTILISSRFLKTRRGDHHTVIGEYYGLLLLCTVGMMMVASARDLLVIFLGIETLSIALYILAGFARARLMSNEAALKYFLLGAFATGFMLYGIALTYFAVGTTLLPDIFQALQQNQNFVTGEAIPTSFLLSAMALLLIGLGFKAALVPFHQWTPDVYEGSPTPVTAFMATGAKAAAFAAFIRVFVQGFGGETVSENWHHIVLVLAVLTMTIGNVVAIAQDSLKRMLAYSSIAHAGYVMIGVLATASAMRAGDGANNLQAIADANASVLVYLAIYALMNLGAFAVLVHMENQRATDPDWDEENANIKIAELRGMAWQKPGIAIALTIFLLSLAGIPPTAGFFGKFYLFMGAVDQGLIGLALVGVINSVISFYFYARPIVEMWMQEAPQRTGDLNIGVDGTTAAIARPAWSLAVTIAIVVCTLAVLGLAGVQAFLNWDAVLQWLPR
jgi:NADH-quinone oxidoreductase subunit N